MKFINRPWESITKFVNKLLKNDVNFVNLLQKFVKFANGLRKKSGNLSIGHLKKNHEIHQSVMGKKNLEFRQSGEREKCQNLLISRGKLSQNHRSVAEKYRKNHHLVAGI